MKNIIPTIIILAAFITVKANEIEFIDDTLTIDKPHVLIVTNRMFNNVFLEPGYFPNQIANDGSLTFLKAYFSESKLMLRKESSLRDLVFHQNQYSDWLVFVHGDSKTLPDAAKRAYELQEQYRVNVIVFSWPSKMIEGNGLKNFKNSRKNVEDGADEFLSFLQQLKIWKLEDRASFPNNKLSILFHSLGNYYLECMVKEEYLEGVDYRIFDNLIINAAAVNQKDHHKWVQKLNIQERIYVNSNNRDFILRGVQILTNWNRQLGVSLVDDYASNATYVNFTKAIKSKFPFNEMHGYYLGTVPNQSDNIRNYYHTILHGEEALKNSFNLFYSKGDSPIFNIQL